MRYDVQQITKRRMQIGWSMSHLATVVGVTPKTITNIEHGMGGKPETIKKIADVLGLNLENLVIDTDTAA